MSLLCPWILFLVFKENSFIALEANFNKSTVSHHRPPNPQSHSKSSVCTRHCLHFDEAGIECMSGFPQIASLLFFTSNKDSKCLIRDTKKS